jgi:hypothetical protein
MIQDPDPDGGADCEVEANRGTSRDVDGAAAADAEIDATARALWSGDEGSARCYSTNQVPAVVTTVVPKTTIDSKISGLTICRLRE